jgi:hypothetical protein
MNIALRSLSLSSLVLGTVYRVLAADNCATAASVYHEVPRLAPLASGDAGRQGAFRGGTQLFSHWVAY